MYPSLGDFQACIIDQFRQLHARPSPVLLAPPCPFSTTGLHTGICSLLSGRHCLQGAHQVSLWTTVNRTKLRAFLRVQRAMQAAYWHNPHGEQTSPLSQLDIPSRQCCWWAEETRQCVYTVWSPLTSPKSSRQQWNSNTSYAEAHWSAEGHRLKINLAYLITF